MIAIVTVGINTVLIARVSTYMNAGADLNASSVYFTDMRMDRTMGLTVIIGEIYAMIVCADSHTGGCATDSVSA